MLQVLELVAWIDRYPTNSLSCRSYRNCNSRGFCIEEVIEEALGLEILLDALFTFFLSDEALIF